jgi:hypothetical protein
MHALDGLHAAAQPLFDPGIRQVALHLNIDSAGRGSGLLVPTSCLPALHLREG